MSEPNNIGPDTQVIDYDALADAALTSGEVRVLLDGQIRKGQIDHIIGSRDNEGGPARIVIVIDVEPI